MKVVKANTFEGERLISIGQECEGTYLCEVYDRWSDAKQKAWDKCYAEYSLTSGSSAFGICSHNTFSFSVSWLTPLGMRLETSKNSYLITFDD